MTSPSILRPLRSSSSSTFYSATYRNSQTEPSTATSTSSSNMSASVGFNDTSPPTHSNNGKNKKQSHAFSTSSSGAFSSRLGLLSNPNISSQKSTGSGQISYGTPGDSALKESATQATSVYFADKHQEINLPPKFVKQMAKLEKERIKLFEKEKVKVNKLMNSALKVSNNAMKSSGSATSSHTKSMLRSGDNNNNNSNNNNNNNNNSNNNNNNNDNTYDKRKYSTDDDRDIRIAAALCLDKEGDRDMVRGGGGERGGGGDRRGERGRDRERGREQDDEQKNNILSKNVPQYDNQYDATPGEEKKNKKLGKLGKITKTVRAYGSGDDSAPVTSTSTSTSIGERMSGTVSSAHADVHTSSIPTSTSTPTIINLSDIKTIPSDLNKQKVDPSTVTRTPGHLQNTPPPPPTDSQMAMLMCAMGSQLGNLGAEIPILEVEPVRVPNKVGRPKLSYKEKVCMLY